LESLVPMKYPGYLAVLQKKYSKETKKGLFVARYDIETGQAYLENAGCTREYVETDNPGFRWA